MAFANPTVVLGSRIQTLRCSRRHGLRHAPVPMPVSVPLPMRMTISDSRSQVSTPDSTETTSTDTDTLPLQATAPLALFRSYFASMTGDWNSERTYHYVPERRREESQTTFGVTRLDKAQVDAVLGCNAELTLTPQEQTYAEGFRVAFLTRMQSQAGLVEAATNLAFVPRAVKDGVVVGDYYRDMGYEEKAPIAARFRFIPSEMCLVMETWYTRVVSIDQIHLASPDVRLRKIVNYKRPDTGNSLTQVLLVGFGVETKGDPDVLVKPIA